MPFCIPEEEYDEELHEIVSGPHDNCDSCSTFPIPEGSEVVVQTTSFLDGARISLIFSDVISSGTVTVGTEFQQVVSSPETIEGTNILVIDINAEFSGSAIVKFELPESTSELEFSKTRVFALHDSPNSNPFEFGGVSFFETYDLMMVDGPYVDNYASRSIYGLLTFEKPSNDSISMMNAASMKVGRAGWFGCTKEEERCKPSDRIIFGDCYPKCPTLKDGKGVRDEDCNCIEVGICCKGKKDFQETKAGCDKKRGSYKKEADG